MKQATLFDRVAFLEAKVARMSEIVFRQDAEITRLKGEVCSTEEQGGTSDRRAMREICTKVAVENDLTIDELRGPSHRRSIAWPRQVAMRRCRAAGFSTTAIGDYLGRRDHTTVIKGIRAAEARGDE